MRRVKSTTVKTGRNAEHPTYADDRYVKCWHCGFICNLDRDIRMRGRAGDGITSYTETGGWGVGFWGIDPWGDETDNPSNPVVTMGCPMCGCLHYDNKEV